MRFAALYGLVPFLLSATLALAFAITYRTLKKRWARRSPLAKRQVGHVPGQQLVTRMSDHEVDMVLSVMLMYLALPLVFMLWAGMRIDLATLRWGVIEWMFLIGGVAIFGYGLYEYIRHLNARDNIRDGLLAERLTGMQLNRLVAQGCIVMHDLPCDGFNIDHIVITPRGVYAVETKSFRKPRNASEDRNDTSHQVRFDGELLKFPDFATKAPIEQALRQADWLRRQLRETIKEDVPVIASVSLPGWFVVQDDLVWRNSTVKVFTPIGDGSNFMAKEVFRLDSAKRALIAKALALRFPQVMG